MDRKQRTVHVYRPNQVPQILENPDSVSGDPELPDFTLPMAKVW
ncbi:Uma2 family endonuclease [Leptolyngbya cf. ectocarpi LEGE 11479]|uniref:Uma2 family endonuclease n=1 Tax=Leptolyngbya cf. ectocarpi LEGE 11479 TaxID=1828722 RepID=A0A929A0R2_LEPEC|nr:Uma2 family endonuclease [Leptolyngbya cf. ectocarpi LEGE 11479]